MNFLRKFISAFIKTFYSVLFLVFAFARKCKYVFKRQFTTFLDDGRENSVVVMGNGPSLNDIDFQKVDREKFNFCCVNDYPVANDYFWKLKPEFLCLIDPGYFDFTIKAEEETKKVLHENLKNVDWKMVIIAPCGKKLPIDNPNLSYRWINTLEIMEKVFIKEKWFLCSHNMANTGLQNVVLGALYYFLSSNYKKIYVTGVDFSDFKNLYVDENNRIYVNTTHSYGSRRIYFDEMKEYGFKEFYTILGAYQKMFSQASTVRKYADFKKIEIINLSRNSYIDSFTKQAPDCLYKQD